MLGFQGFVPLVVSSKRSWSIGVCLFFGITEGCFPPKEHRFSLYFVRKIRRVIISSERKPFLVLVQVSLLGSSIQLPSASDLVFL